MHRVDHYHLHSSTHIDRCRSFSNNFNFSYSGYLETCYWESQSHARSLGWVPSGGNRDRALYSIQVSDFEPLWKVNLLKELTQHMKRVGEDS